MKPRFELDGARLRANVRAYAALGAPVAAVVKHDGYGWGAARIVREIDDLVESYVIADEAEFWALRMRTRRPLRLLAAIAASRIAPVCAAGGVPNVMTADALDAAAAHAARSGRPATIRIGIIDAAGWAGIRPAHAAAFAARCRDVRVELWTHVTSEARRADTLGGFFAAAAAFADAGCAPVSLDVASTAWASPELALSRVRIGAGLFGAGMGSRIGVRCAIRVAAPVVQWHEPGAIGWAGYGDFAVPANRGLAVLRCGYGDGFPKKLAGYDDILSVGMQYTTRLANRPAREHALIDDASDLDRLAERLSIGPHELITGLAHNT